MVRGLKYSGNKKVIQFLSHFFAQIKDMLSKYFNYNTLIVIKIINIPLDFFRNNRQKYIIYLNIKYIILNLEINGTGTN